ncbi:MAG: hypothetical protein AB1371_03505 [Pseudomonadota bacterium]
MTVSREFVIPRFMINSVEGHIPGDPHYYHLLALKKANELRDLGVRAFELRPEGQGVAGIASIVFAIYPSPYLIVVMNSLLHALSVLLMARILLNWFPLRTSLVAVVPLALSPYMIIWFSQLNKDSFALIGVMLITYGLVCLLRLNESRLSGYAWGSLCATVAGVVLVWIVRPYINQIYLPIVALVFLVAILAEGVTKRVVHNISVGKKTFYGVFVLTCLAFLGHGAASDKTLDSLENYTEVTGTISESNAALYAQCLKRVDKNFWRDAWFLPEFVNNKLRALVGQRCLIFTILETQDNATTLRSIVDLDRLPGGSIEALSYAPRAALLGIFSPWPNAWTYIFEHGRSTFYTIVPIETILLYVGLGCLGWWIVRGKQWLMLVPVITSIAVMSVY